MLIDLHNHSRESSQCSGIPAALLSERYSARSDVHGYCLTDHLSARNVPFLTNGDRLAWPQLVERLCAGHRGASGSIDGHTRLFFGIEYGVQLDDFLVYGLEPEDLTGADYLSEFSVGALRRLKQEFPHVAVVQAHPFRKRCRLLEDDVVDAIEVYNGLFFHDAENERAREHARTSGKIGVAGTDCHEDDVGRMLTQFVKPVHSNRELAAAIRAGDIAGFKIYDIARDIFLPYDVLRRATPPVLAPNRPSVAERP